jgi:polysaccharide export outer membrane protein
MAVACLAPEKSDPHILICSKIDNRLTRNKNMQLKISNLLLALFFASMMSGMAQLNAAEVDASQLEKQCKNITTQQRQMAKAAGYDVDAACNSLKDAKKSGKDEAAENLQTILSRDAEFETNERGVIGEQQQTEFDDRNEQQTEIDTESEQEEEQQLVRYGYDLFAGVPTTFAPTTNIPVPVDYVVGPGDSMQIQLLGKINESHELSVGRGGAISFPELGPIAISGLKFSEAKQLVQQKVSEQMIGVRAVISLGELRSIRVFILGEAFKPGSYTVSSLSTMTNALLVSGGITDIGSLRNIQLKRQGNLVTTLDLYDLLQKGDTSKDARLLPGDVIYIPPVGRTVGIQGEVKRPAIYELKQEHSLQSLIQLAGGYSANAYPNVSHITRKSKSGFTTVLDMDLSLTSAKSTQLNNGDLVEVSTVLEELENVVELSGAFHRERAVKWHKGLALSDVINSVNDFKEGVDLNIAIIIRKEMPLRKVSVLNFSLRDLIKTKQSKSSKSDLQLQPLDQIITFMQDNSRIEVLEPIITSLLEQNYGGALAHLVDISGNVRYPGRYPLSQNMNARELVLMAGGLAEASYMGNAEITRRDFSNAETATIEHINVNLAEQLSGVNSFELKAKDKLTIYVTPEYRESLNITLTGEVRFPGDYEFKRGETLTQVIHRAGGFTPMAHIGASVFTRTDLKLLESKQLKELQEKMREDIAASQLQDAAAGKASSLNDSEGLLKALSETEALGRLVIQLEKIVSGKIKDIQLKDGDQLTIPSFRQEVSVLGEVQHATSHLFNEQWTLEDYLEKSGGLTNRADDDRIYVVKADGSVFLPNQSGWLTHQNELLHPGDTVVVPLDTDRIKSLALWTSVSQIVYQLTLGAAAVNSF